MMYNTGKIVGGVKMSYTRVVKFQYFTLWSRIKVNNRWQDSGKFDFISWISNIKKNNLLMKKIEFGDTTARIEKVTHDDLNDLWTLRLMKLRDTNIPSKVKDNKEAEVIPLEDDEYIGEDITILYDKSTGIAMIQSNRFSLGITKLTEFINYTKVTSTSDIVIKPIRMDIDLKSFKKDSYKNIEIGFANIIRDVPSSKSPLATIINSYRKFHGVVGKVTIGLGRTKDSTLNIQEVNSLLSDLGNYEEVISAKLKVKDDDSSRVEIIDLFDNIFNDLITFELEKRTSLAYEQAVVQMIEYYKEKKGKILSQLYIK